MEDYEIQNPLSIEDRLILASYTEEQLEAEVRRRYQVRFEIKHADALQEKRKLQLQSIEQSKRLTPEYIEDSKRYPFYTKLDYRKAAGMIRSEFYNLKIYIDSQWTKSKISYLCDFLLKIQLDEDGELVEGDFYSLPGWWDPIFVYKGFTTDVNEASLTKEKPS